MTRLAAILEDRNLTYADVAERAHLQPRTVRQIASVETPIDNVAVGRVRKIASALSIPVLCPARPRSGLSRRCLADAPCQAVRRDP